MPFKQLLLENILLHCLLKTFIDSYRKEVSFLNKDRLLHTDIQKSIDFLKSIHFQRIYCKVIIFPELLMSF